VRRSDPGGHHGLIIGNFWSVRACLISLPAALLRGCSSAGTAMSVVVSHFAVRFLWECERNR
jgi:hypothetical protein